MSNSNYYISFDFETSSANHSIAQILSIGAVVIHPKRLEIMPESEFYTLVYPENKDAIDPKALEINKLTMEQLLDPDNPKIETAWKRFVNYIKSYNPGNNIFTAPIPCGYNIVNYDLPIVDRMARRFKNVDADGIPNIFHFRDKLDLITDMFRWTEARSDMRSLSFDNVRKWLGMSGEGAHNSLADSKDAAALAIKIIRLHRYLSPKIQFENSFQKDPVNV